MAPDETILLQLAAQLEVAAPWLHRRPSMYVRRGWCRDIRELTDSPEAYAAELRRRWGGLSSYRYIGRSYAAMDVGPVDNTVQALPRDMRNQTGGLLLAVLGIASPDAALHIGPQFVILETAGVESAAGIAGTDRMQGVWRRAVMILARGKVGPFRIEAEPMVGSDGMLAVRTLMRDEGADDRLTTVGVVPAALRSDSVLRQPCSTTMAMRSGRHADIDG